jgi:hypothetical protein
MMKIATETTVMMMTTAENSFPISTGPQRSKIPEHGQLKLRGGNHMSRVWLPPARRNEEL